MWHVPHKVDGRPPAGSEKHRTSLCGDTWGRLMSCSERLSAVMIMMMAKAHLGQYKDVLQIQSNPSKITANYLFMKH